jgi:hypothetical protein
MEYYVAIGSGGSEGLIAAQQNIRAQGEWKLPKHKTSHFNQCVSIRDGSRDIPDHFLISKQ